MEHEIFPLSIQSIRHLEQSAHYDPIIGFVEINLLFEIGPLRVSVTITHQAEVNLAWWLAWTSNPVVVHREVG
jgi:hypothetical protein